MTIDANIVGPPTGSVGSNVARVTRFGQLIVGPVEYSSVSTKTLGTDDEIVNFVAPIAGAQIVITDILLYANNLVGGTDATVQVFESSVGPASSVVSTCILLTEVAQRTSRDLTGLNLITSEGVWINAVTDNDDVFVTIMFYHVPVTE